MCEIIWATNQSYTEWDTTREGALEKSLNALFNYHGDVIRFHKNNLNPFNNK
jgi:hypothetical protein